jgi:hypothetical protein
MSRVWGLGIFHIINNFNIFTWCDIQQEKLKKWNLKKNIKKLSFDDDDNDDDGRQRRIKKIYAQLESSIKDEKNNLK